MRTALAALVVALVLAPAAAAASPLMPLEQQAQMNRILASFGYQDLGYVPTKAPAHYTYQSNVVSSTQNLVTLADGSDVAYFTVQFFNGKLSACNKGSQVTLTISGLTVYSKGVDVWRCLKAADGRLVKVNGHGPGLSRQDLGAMIVSAKRTS